METNQAVDIERRDIGNNNEDLLGMVVYNEDEAYKLYNDYATRIGFSIRKQKIKYLKDKVLRQRDYVCSKEGFQRDSSSCEAKKMNRLETRTGCKAGIRFTVENGEWKVTSFKQEHNHELVKVEHRQFLRSNRRITDAYSSVLTTFKEAGIRTIGAYSYMSEETGGFEIVGFTKRDAYNFVNRQKLIIKVEAGDAQSSINLFKQKQVEDPMFFYAVQVDQKNRMTNFFWRDGRSMIDYESFSG